MLATKRSAGVTPQVNLRECVTCMPPLNSNKAAHRGFEAQRRCHQKSKTGGISGHTKKEEHAAQFAFYLVHCETPLSDFVSIYYSLRMTNQYNWFRFNLIQSKRFFLLRLKLH